MKSTSEIRAKVLRQLFPENPRTRRLRNKRTELVQKLLFNPNVNREETIERIKHINQQLLALGWCESVRVGEIAASMTTREVGRQTKHKPK
jgi:hypothetical protein